jgi:PTS system nitrogen regulatory IIA component
MYLDACRRFTTSRWREEGAMGNDVMDLQQLATFLGRDARELGKMANRGHLPGRKVGGEWRFAAAEIQNWVESEMPGWTEQELQGIDHISAAGFNPIIASLIPRECIDLNFSARTKTSAIRALVTLADNSGRVWDTDAIRAAVERREELGTTAWPGGFATPHPHRRLPQVQGESVIAFARSPGGLPFGARGMTDLFFLICCTDNRQHLRVLSRLSRILRRDGFVDELRAAEAPADVLRLLEAAEIALQTSN